MTCMGKLWENHGQLYEKNASRNVFTCRKSLSSVAKCTRKPTKTYGRCSAQSLDLVGTWDYDMWTNSKFPKDSAQERGLKTCRHVCTKPANSSAQRRRRAVTAKKSNFADSHFLRHGSASAGCRGRALHCSSQIPLPEKYNFLLEGRKVRERFKCHY